MRDEFLKKIIEDVDHFKKQFANRKYFYLYLIFYPDGSYYLGSRVSNCYPIVDDYMGSSKYKKPDGKKYILDTFSTQDELNYAETLMIRKYKDDPKCINENSTPKSLSYNSNNKKYYCRKELAEMFKRKPSTIWNAFQILDIDTRISKNQIVLLEDRLDEFKDYFMQLDSGVTISQYLEGKNLSEKEIEERMFRIGKSYNPTVV